MGITGVGMQLPQVVGGGYPSIAAASPTGEETPGNNGQRSGRINDGSASSGNQLDAKDQQKVEELKQGDQRVRQHEMAHLAAAGAYARSGPQYTYVTGPDGQLYIVAGEVDLDASPVPGDPQATITKAETVQQAALAPADPSPQDRRVAADAERMEFAARQELMAKNMEAMKNATSRASASTSGSAANTSAAEGMHSTETSNTLPGMPGSNQSNPSSPANYSLQI